VLILQTCNPNPFLQEKKAKKSEFCPDFTTASSSFFFAFSLKSQRGLKFKGKRKSEAKYTAVILCKS